MAIFALGENGRGGQIRTDDLYVPNVALYQAKLHPDVRNLFCFSLIITTLLGYLELSL